MKLDRESLQSARRHFGVALIDLHYAANDLAHYAASRDAGGKVGDILRDLEAEIARLREIGEAIESNGEIEAPHPWIAHHWPDLVRRNAALHSGRN